MDAPLITIFLSALLIFSTIAPSSAQRILGIDVAHHQEFINWTNVRSSGIVFAWTKATEETNFVDWYLQTNVLNAKAAGVLMGAFHFARPDVDPTLAGADAEAAFFWKIAGSTIIADGLTMNPVLDCESDPPTNMTKAFYSQWANRWCNDIVARGKSNHLALTPIIYCSKSFGKKWLDATVTNLPLWVHTGQSDPQRGNPGNVHPWSAWTFWQYGQTIVPGVTNGTSDSDVFIGSRAALSRYIVTALP